jgi:hypothetical protein
MWVESRTQVMKAGLVVSRKVDGKVSHYCDVANSRFPTHAFACPWGGGKKFKKCRFQ